MAFEERNTIRKSPRNGIEMLDSKLKGTTIFNDSTNLCQSVEIPNPDPLQKIEDSVEFKITHNPCLVDRQTQERSDVVGDATVERTIDKTNTVVGLAFLPGQRENLSRKNGGSFSFMAVGPAGSGKTTFINTLFGSDLAGNRMRKETQPTTKVSALRFEVIEDGFLLKVNVVDTPGFGQSVDNLFAWVPATKYAEDQFKIHLSQEEQPIRKNIFDNRVHCCLYFITPNGKGLSQLDISSMKELSRRVNLIPVIAKSDAFDTDDLINFKQVVRDTLSLHSISVCDLVLDQNLKEQINSNMPFAVIGSNEYHENSQGKLIRGRKYKWGIADVENPKHCDFMLLREIMMGSNMLDLILSTEVHYENFRSLYLGEKFKDAIREKHLSEAHVSQMNGLEQKVHFHQTLLTSFNNSLQEEDPILLYKQLKMKDKFAGIISNQERRFKDWKKALIEKQNAFNIDIEKFHNKIIKLQDTIAHLEAGYVIYNDSDYESTDSDIEVTKEYNECKNSFKSPTSQFT